MEREIWDIVKALDKGKLTVIEAHKKLCGLHVVTRGFSKEDLSKAYQAGCLESLEECVKYSFKDHYELQQESLKWVERYTK